MMAPKHQPTSIAPGRNPGSVASFEKGDRKVKNILLKKSEGLLDSYFIFILSCDSYCDTSGIRQNGIHYHILAVIQK